MGRTRPKTRKARPPAPEQTDSQRENKSEPTTEALLEKAQELIVQCDYDLAGRFVERVLKRAPDNVEAKEILGVVQLETGLLDAAKQVRSTSYRKSHSAFSLVNARPSYRCCRLVQEHHPHHHPLRIYILPS
jgi:Flp pilus assembly protein TadD